MAVWSRITGAIAGIGVGGAAAAAMEPILEVPKQKAWSGEPNRVLDLGTLATLVATGLLEETAAVDEAKRNGFGENRLKARIQAALSVPGISEMRDMLNRDAIKGEQFDHALAKHGIEAQYRPAYYTLLGEVLDPGQLAAAIHRGLIPDPGLLKGQQPEPPFNVEAYPVYQIPAVKEAKASGYDKDRLGVLVGLQGLPMGVIEAAQSFYRGILTKGDYIRAFNESNNRNEWAEAVLEYARQIPTARDYIENALRGYRTLEKAQEGAARHGMSPEDARLIFQNSGRPLNLHQITQAKAWGAKYNPLPGDDPDPYMNSVLIGSVTPAYYEMQDTLKYNLPSAFFFRVLQQQGVLTEAEAVVWYKRLGWPEELATKVAKAFAATTPAKADPYVSKAETQLWGAIHRSYIAGESNEDTAISVLTALGLDLAAISAVIGLWTNERELVRKQLTPAQIKKAYGKAEVNPATNAPWTRADALARLTAQGMSFNDAVSLLDL